MEAVRETVYKYRDMVTGLLEEYRVKPDDDTYNEILLQLARGVDDTLLLIQNLERKRQIGIRERAQFIEMSKILDEPGIKKLVVIRGELLTSKRGVIGNYQVLWNKGHPCNYGGECAVANVTMENTALTAIITLIAGCERMKIRDIALYLANDSIQGIFQNLEALAQNPNKVSPFLLNEFRRMRAKKELKITVIEENVMKHAVSRFGKIEDWW